MNSRRLTDAAIRLGVIEEDSRELYEFAFSNLLFSILTWGVLILIGIVTEQVTGCIIFMAFYIPLRVFCGGFNMPSRTLCLITSVVIYSVMFGIFTAGVAETIVFKLCATGSIPVIALMAPVESLNKPLYPQEVKRNKKISLYLLSAALFGLAALKAMNQNELLYFASFALVTLSTLMLLGAASNIKNVKCQRVRNLSLYKWAQHSSHGLDTTLFKDLNIFTL